MLKSSLPFAGFVSELILAAGAFSSGLTSLLVCACILYRASLWLLHLVTVVRIVFGGDIPVIDPVSKKNIKRYYLDEGIIIEF